jgi:hypothetical protein
MDAVRDYQICLAGELGDAGRMADGPLQTAVLHADERATVIAVRADQSGLIGVLRHLHGRGRVVLSVHSGDAVWPERRK